MIAVMAVRDGILGYKDNGRLPWYCGDDTAFMKSVTAGKHLLVGGSTARMLTGLLKTKDCTVITSNPIKGLRCRPKPSYDMLSDDTVLFGGAAMYKEYLRFCSDVYLTEIREDLEPRGGSEYVLYHPDLTDFRFRSVDRFPCGSLCFRYSNRNFTERT